MERTEWKERRSRRESGGQRYKYLSKEGMHGILILMTGAYA
jgi:hypothetical protein